MVWSTADNVNNNNGANSITLVRNEPKENFKWEYVVRQTNQSRNRVNDSNNTLNSPEADQNQAHQTDSIKFVIVTVALIGVVCGAAFVYFTEEELISIEETEPTIEVIKYNSYFGGLLRLVKVNGTQNRLFPDCLVPPSATISVDLNIPEVHEILEILHGYAEHFYSEASNMVQDLWGQWTGNSKCECVAQ